MNLVGGLPTPSAPCFAVGIMMLPAAVARFWARDITSMILMRDRHRRGVGLYRPAALVSTPASRRDRPSCLVAGGIYAVSVIFGG